MFVFGDGSAYRFAEANYDNYDYGIASLVCYSGSSGYDTIRVAACPNFTIGTAEYNLVIWYDPFLFEAYGSTIYYNSWYISNTAYPNLTVAEKSLTLLKGKGTYSGCPYYYTSDYSWFLWSTGSYDGQLSKLLGGKCEDDDEWYYRNSSYGAGFFGTWTPGGTAESAVTVNMVLTDYFQRDSTVTVSNGYPPLGKYIGYGIFAGKVLYIGLKRYTLVDDAASLSSVFDENYPSEFNSWQNRNSTVAGKVFERKSGSNIRWDTPMTASFTTIYDYGGFASGGAVWGENEKSYCAWMPGIG